MSACVFSYSLPRKRRKYGLEPKSKIRMSSNGPILQEGCSGESKPKTHKEVSALDAAMHYIDFQKENW